jgi:signal transduction histidine kinase
LQLELVQRNTESADLLDELIEAATLLKGNLQRAHKLVQNFKKVSVNQLTDTLESVALPGLVQDVIDLFQINARKAKLTITIDNQLQTTTPWHGYPGYFTQVLLNLLTNIERYAYGPHGGPVAIDLADAELARQAAFQVTVRDYGAGIDPQHLPHIFEPFFTTGRAQGGTGLGMAIVYNLVTEALRGTIGITSVPAHSTSVTVTIPTIITPPEPRTESRSLHG